MENTNYKSQTIDKKYLENLQENQFYIVKNSFSELEKDFIELKDRKIREKSKN